MTRPLLDLFTNVPQYVWQTVLGAVAVTATVVVVWQLLRGAKLLARKVAAAGRPGEDILTIAVACIATAVSAQGMWRFAGDVLGMDGVLRVMLFAFIELAVLASAVRARRNMRENYSAGIDGMAVWALACLTAVLSALDARSLAEALFRLAAPLVAAWLWERGMAVERHRITGRSRIKWRFTPERAMVRLGLAEVSDRTVTEVDAHRRLTRVALSAKRARALRDAGAPDRKVRAALARLDQRLDQAVEHTGLARDEAAQRALLDQVTTLYGGMSLLDLPDTAPWRRIDHPAVTPPAVVGQTTTTVVEDPAVVGETPTTVVDTPTVAPEVHPDPVPDPAGYAPPVPVVPVSQEVFDWSAEQDLFDSSPGGGAISDPVPEGVPDEPEYVPGEVSEELQRRATSRFLADVMTGTVPGVRQLKTELSIGQEKAQQVRAYLATLATL